MTKLAGPIFALSALFAFAAFAADEAGTIKNVKGSATVERAGQKHPATVGLKVNVADRVITGADGAVGIALRDDTMLSAGPNSVLSLDKFAFDAVTHKGKLDASVTRGSLSVISGTIAKTDPDAVRFRTPSATLGVRGTDFVIEVADDEAEPREQDP